MLAHAHASFDGSDTVRIADQTAPRVLASADDGLVAVPHQQAQLVGTAVVPDVLHQVDFSAMNGDASGPLHHGCALGRRPNVSDEAECVAGRPLSVARRVTAADQSSGPSTPAAPDLPLSLRSAGD